MYRAAAPPTAHEEKPTRFRLWYPSPCGLKHSRPFPSPGLVLALSRGTRGGVGKHHLPLLPRRMGLRSVHFIFPGPTASLRGKASSFFVFPLLLPWPKDHLASHL